MHDHSDIKRLVADHWRRRAAAFDDRPNYGLHCDEQHAAWLRLLGDLAGATPLAQPDAPIGLVTAGFARPPLSKGAPHRSSVRSADYGKERRRTRNRRQVKDDTL